MWHRDSDSPRCVTSPLAREAHALIFTPRPRQYTRPITAFIPALIDCNPFVMAGLVPAISLKGTLMPSRTDSRTKYGHHDWDFESPFPSIGIIQVPLSATHTVMPGEGPASMSLQLAVKNVPVAAKPRCDECVAIIGNGYKRSRGTEIATPVSHVTNTSYSCVDSPQQSSCGLRLRAHGQCCGSWDAPQEGEVEFVELLNEGRDAADRKQVSEVKREWAALAGSGK
jgi:hypothetical protein